MNDEDIFVAYENFNFTEEDYEIIISIRTSLDEAYKD